MTAFLHWLFRLPRWATLEVESDEAVVLIQLRSPDAARLYFTMQAFLRLYLDQGYRVTRREGW